MCVLIDCCVVFFFKQKTAYEMRISDWSSDVCSSDLFLATLQGSPEEETAQAGAAKAIDDPASPQESRALVAAATSATDDRRERPELDAHDDEREGEGAVLADPSDHKPRAPRQPKEATDAPAIIIQGRRGIVLSGQEIGRAHVELQSLMRIS